MVSFFYSKQREVIMGYRSKVQVIVRGSNQQRQFYFICPAPLAEALEIEKGETVEWVVQDRNTLIIRRHGESDE